MASNSPSDEGPSSSPRLTAAETPQVPATPLAHTTTDLFVSPAQSSESATPELVVRKRPHEDDDLSLNERIKTLRKTSEGWEARAADVGGTPNDRIDAQQQSLSALLEVKSIEMDLVDEKYQKGEITEEEKQHQRFRLLRERHHVSQSSTLIEGARHHLIDEELERQAQHPGAINFLEDSITTLLDMVHKSSASFKKNKIVHGGCSVTFRDVLIDRYNGSKDAEGLRVWCPIIGKFLANDRVKAAHIIPRALHKKPALIQKVFSINTDNIEGFLRAARNGLLMASQLEEKFDQGWFVLLPTRHFGTREVPEFRVHVIRESVLDKVAFTFDDKPPLKFRDLDGKQLKFPDGCNKRPSRRCLFFRMIISILMAKADGEADWKTQITALAEKKQWMSPGRYLVSSIITQLWSVALQTEIPSFIENGLFDGDVSKTEARARMMDLVATLDADALKRKGEISDDGGSGDEFVV